MFPLVREVYQDESTSFAPFFGLGEENVAFQSHFQGKSYLQPLCVEGVKTFNVTFEPATRNDWHIHHLGGQILLCTDGEGWYQEEGQKARKLHPGDVVYIAPEVKHWHGATKDSWFSHVAIEIPHEKGNTEWLEPVSDEAYSKL